jgi:hypothetical protein
MSWYDYVGYVLIPVLTYFAGAQRERRRQRLEDARHEARESAEKIERVVERYADLVHRGGRRYTGFAAMIAAGARDLSDREAREAVRKLVEIYGMKLPPLGRRFHDRILQLPDLREFFKRAPEGDPGPSIEPLLEELEATSSRTLPPA